MYQSDYNKSCKYAMLCHLSGLLIFVTPILHLLVTLILWLIKRDESLFINDQGKEALNLQLSMVLYLFIAGIIPLPFTTPLLGGAILLFGAFQIIMASIRAGRGEHYRYPLTIRFL